MNTKKTIKKRLVLKKSVRNFCTRVLITVIIFLVGMILVKNNTEIKNVILEQIYNKNFKFTKAKKFYEKYFGDILSSEQFTNDEQAVFQEKLTYKKANTYLDGVALTVDNNYMVPVLETGIVIFMGEKEGYGNTVVIEQIDGVDVSYSNISTDGIQLYDYVEKGSLLGEVNNKKLYLVFQQDGEYLDYKRFV